MQLEYRGDRLPDTAPRSQVMAALRKRPHQAREKQRALQAALERIEEQSDHEA